jgi:hypothetical protein
MAPARVRSAIRGLNRSGSGFVSQTRPDQQRVWSEVNRYAEFVDQTDETSSLVNMLSGNFPSNTAITIISRSGVIFYPCEPVRECVGQATVTGTINYSGIGHPSFYSVMGHSIYYKFPALRIYPTTSY